MQRAANAEAITQLNSALELLKTLPDTPERAQQELMLQVTLGVTLIVTKGYAASEVGAAYTQARKLCQQVSSTPQLCQVLGGMWQFYLVRAEYQTAREVGEQLLTLAQDLRDPLILLEAHNALGQVSFCLGEPISARVHLEQGIALYNPKQLSSSLGVCG